jgi:predicted transcriptional regulator
MIVHGVKRLVVIDDDGKLRGMVDREAVLRAIAGRA